MDTVAKPLNTPLAESVKMLVGLQFFTYYQIRIVSLLVSTEHVLFVIRAVGVFLRRVFLPVAASGSRAVLQQQLGTEQSACLCRHRRPVCLRAAASRKPPAGQYAPGRRQPARRVRTTQTGSLEASTLRAGKRDEDRMDHGVEPHPARAAGAAVRRRRVRRRTAPAAVSRHRGGDAARPG